MTKENMIPKYPNYEELRLKAWDAIHKKRAEVLKEHEVKDFKSTSEFLNFLNNETN